MISIDGSQMDGGGQILRMATTYACVLNKPFEFYNIRGKRRNPGLRPQHLATIKAAAEMCSGELTGGEINSTTITLKPGKIRGEKYSIDIGTAGSISLMLQCLAPISLYASSPTTFSIRGGTDVNWSPPVTFLEKIVYPAFKKMGVFINIITEKTGFYPKGGGKVIFQSNPVDQLRPFFPEEGGIERVAGVSKCGNLPVHIAQRQAGSATRILKEAGFSAQIDFKTVSSLSPGSAICIWAKSKDMFLGASSLGDRGKPAEKVGSEATSSLISQIKTGANVDKHTADHLILPCSLAEGVSEFKVSEITLHTLTAIEMARVFTDSEITVKGNIGKPGAINVQGIGLRN
jgi:RNA 3'-terminal phosphate cyclase (ATP)